MTVTATNPKTAAQRSATFTWYWHGTLSITPPPDPATVGGSPVDLEVKVSDSPRKPPVMFTALGLPAGLSMSAAGKITGAQLWMASPDGTIRTGSKCLEVHGGGTASGTLVDTYRCNGTGAEQWRLISDGGGVMLKNPRSGLCLADPGDSGVNGARLEILSCSRHDPGRASRVS